MLWASLSKVICDFNMLDCMKPLVVGLFNGNNSQGYQGSLRVGILNWQYLISLNIFGRLLCGQLKNGDSSGYVSCTQPDSQSQSSVHDPGGGGPGEYLMVTSPCRRSTLRKVFWFGSSDSVHIRMRETITNKCVRTRTFIKRRNTYFIKIVCRVKAEYNNFFIYYTNKKSGEKNWHISDTSYHYTKSNNCCPDKNTWLLVIWDYNYYLWLYPRNIVL